MACTQADKDAAIAEIRALIGDRLSTSGAVREQHGSDESWHKAEPPDADGTSPPN